MEEVLRLQSEIRDGLATKQQHAQAIIRGKPPVPRRRALFTHIHTFCFLRNTREYCRVPLPSIPSNLDVGYPVLACK